MNLIVFDIDDTLTRSEFQHQHAYVETMKEFGINDINQNWGEYLHLTDSHILKVNYENNVNTAFDMSFISAFEKRMTELILTLKKVIEVPGANDMISSFLTNPNYCISFATGSLLKPAHVKLQQAGISYHQNVLSASNQLYTRESIVTESIAKAKNHYKVDSFDHIISVGDGIWDLKTARNLGVHFVGIGMKNHTEFMKEEVLVHIEDWQGFDLKQIEHKLGII